MLALTYFYIFKVNQEKVNSLCMQMHCGSSLTDDIFQFYNAINCQTNDATYLY